MREQGFEHWGGLELVRPCILGPHTPRSDMPWQQPPENSLAALVHGMQVSDGVELDLRLSADGELVLYHDTQTADGRFPECEDSSSMPGHVCTFDEVLAESGFTNPWLEGSVLCCTLRMIFLLYQLARDLGSLVLF